MKTQAQQSVALESDEEQALPAGSVLNNRPVSRGSAGEFRTTPETRAKAAAARAAKVAAGAKYRRDFADSASWDSLAQKRGIRLPMWHTPPTPRQLKKWHGKLGDGGFDEVYGCSPTRLIELNPTWPLRAFIGVMLES